MLLYLTKYSRPDLCNVVRELAKCMDKATKGTYLEMLRVMKFVIDMTLSSSEAEYVAMSEAVREIKFIYYLLRDIRIDLELPIIVKTDNVGVMFMAQNASSGVRTRHVDTRYHFVRENLEEGIIKIEFAVENESDIFTKNVTQEIY